VAVLGSCYIEVLELRGCGNLRTVVLTATCFSWEVLHRLNEKWAEGARQSRINCRSVADEGRTKRDVEYTFYCQDILSYASFGDNRTLNLSNCHSLESLDGIGSLASLRCLYLRNCRKLRTLPDLSSSPFLEVVDLSFCCSVGVLGDQGPLRSLQYLYLRECGSLTGLGDLGSPDLKVIDLSGCSKLECLGDFSSLRSLQRLDLSDCVSLRSMPNLSHCCLLEVLDVKGCVNLMSFLHDTVGVWDLSKLVSLRSMDVSGNLVVRELGKYLS
jgi:Leucine-rich repeat (LRR) protein